MTNISILKLRKIPLLQRLDLLECLTPIQCYDECFFILHLLSEEKEIRYDLVSKTLNILFGYHVNHVWDSYDIKGIIVFKCIDLLPFVQLFLCPYFLNKRLTNQDGIVGIIEGIIILKQNHKDIKQITTILEDTYIEFSKNINTIYATTYLLERVPMINKIKMLDFLLSNKNTDDVMHYLKQTQFNYTENSIIRNKIQNILNIYDIIM